VKQTDSMSEDKTGCCTASRNFNT